MSPSKYLPCVISLGFLFLAPLVHSQQGSDVESIKNRLVGSYRLVSFNAIDEAGNAVRRPYSVGRISYDGVGRMTAQLMPEGWDASSSISASGAGFISYFGTFTIDSERQAVIHHVEGAYNANMLGRSMVRYFEFSADGNSLFLETRNDNRATGRLRWDRILTED
jgi:hypothetical protein